MKSADFAKLIGALGPFGPAPRLAVATSGGADSLALALLTQEWAKARGGEVVALTVDHRLRPGSAAEARQVGRILKPLGIRHRILTWSDPAPAANLQALARAARYRLLLDHCSRQGILHLLLAHHRDDQAETLLLRLGRGSGLDGLAAMSPRTVLPQAVLLRPLLSVPRAELTAWLSRRGVAWIEDPSNMDTAHARVRLRGLMPALAAEGLDAGRLAAAAGHLGRARAAVEAMTARVLARAARIDPAGYIRLDPRPLLDAEAEVGLRALAHAVMTVGGRAYTPRWERLKGLFQRLGEAGFRGATLGGCRIASRAGALLIAREAAGVEALEAEAGDRIFWDGRFDIALKPRAASGPFRVAGLDKTAWAEARQSLPEPGRLRVPALARAGVPAIFDRKGLRALPALTYEREPGDRTIVKACSFAPSAALTSSGFTVA